MKTSLKYLAFFLAVALPGTFAAELAGVSLPASLDPLHAFSAIVVELSVLMLFADYAAAGKPTLVGRTLVTAPKKSHHPLAA
jgi:hypothetical protein